MTSRRTLFKDLFNNGELGTNIKLRSSLSKNILWQWISASHKSKQWSPASYFEDYLNKQTEIAYVLYGYVHLEDWERLKQLFTLRGT